MPNGSIKTEADSIRELRLRYPKTGAYKLARRIFKKDFFASTDKGSDYTLAVAVNPPVRTFYSILSVIRRFDALKKITKAGAAAAAA